MKFQNLIVEFSKHIVQLEKLSSVELQAISSRPAAREHLHTQFQKISGKSRSDTITDERLNSYVYKHNLSFETLSLQKG